MLWRLQIGGGGPWRVKGAVGTIASQGATDLFGEWCYGINRGSLAAMRLEVEGSVLSFLYDGQRVHQF
jgi:hypothetical protein